MKTALFPLILDKYLAGSLMIEQDLTKDQFEIVLVYVVACARYLIITHISEVKRCAVAVTGLRDGVNVSATLQSPDILFGTKNGSDIKPVMG